MRNIENWCKCHSEIHPGNTTLNLMQEKKNFGLPKQHESKQVDPPTKRGCCIIKMKQTQKLHHQQNGTRFFISKNLSHNFQASDQMESVMHSCISLKLHQIA